MLLARRWRADGRVLSVIADAPANITAILPSARPRLVSVERTITCSEQTLNRPPRHYTSKAFSFDRRDGAAVGPLNRRDRNPNLRMAKITFIGAGSTVFARNLLGDILGHEELAGSEIALFDIDAERLATSELVARRVADALDAPAKIVATTDRRAALDGADYAINMIQVGGYEPCTVTDFEVPKRFGLRQTIGDTLGIGGIMRGLRTIPVLLSMCADMEELCPDVWFLNYTNPMAINCRAIGRASSIRTVGLCHSVQGTAFELSIDLGIPYREIDYLAAGINHMAFYLRFERDGVDLYPQLRALADSGRVPEGNRVRYEMLRRLGYFVTESSEHFAEYVPWFIKRDRPDLVEQFNVPLDEYPRRCVEQIARWDAEREPLEARRHDRGAAELRVRGDDHPQHRDRQAARDLRQRPQRRADRRPAGGLHRRGAVPRRRERRAADADRRAAAAARRAHPHQRQRAGAHRRSRAHRPPRPRVPRRDARPAHRGRARPRPDPRARRRVAHRAR